MPSQTDRDPNSDLVIEDLTESATPAVPSPDPICSAVPATVGRELHLYGRLLQHHHELVPQPCQVVFCHASADAVRDRAADQRVNVNANIDAIQFPGMLEQMRMSAHGATFPALRVYDPLTPAQRSRLADVGEFWCEWPPRV